MSEWKLSSAKYIGLSHITRGIPCQDSSSSKTVNGVHIVALSDGCGSSKHSEEGSRITTEVITSLLSSNFDNLYTASEEMVKKTIVKHIIRNVDHFAFSNKKLVDGYLSSPEGKIKFNELQSFEIGRLLSRESLNALHIRMMFDATVLFVAVNGNRFIAGHCGDGYILSVKNNNLEVLSSEPKTGASNETTYPSTILAFEEAYKRKEEWDAFRIYRGNVFDLKGFILMSDGAECSLISKKNKQEIPHLNNNSLLLDMVKSENEDDAKRFMSEVLEKTYRKVRNAQGQEIEVTDDDVSVSVLVDTSLDIASLTANEVSNDPIVLTDNVSAEAVEEKEEAPIEEEKAKSEQEVEERIEANEPKKEEKVDVVNTSPAPASIEPPAPKQVEASPKQEPNKVTSVVPPVVKSGIKYYPFKLSNRELLSLKNLIASKEGKYDAVKYEFLQKWINNAIYCLVYYCSYEESLFKKLWEISGKRLNKDEFKQIIRYMYFIGIVDQSLRLKAPRRVK